jgi:hypothetical protein
MPIRSELVTERLYFDQGYDSHCLWYDDGSGMWDLDLLPLSERTRTDARAWSKRVSTLMWNRLHRSWERAAIVDATEWATAWAESEQQGEELWRRIRNELAPDFVEAPITAHGSRTPATARRSWSSAPKDESASSDSAHGWTSGGPEDESSCGNACSACAERRHI